MQEAGLARAGISGRVRHWVVVILATAFVSLSACNGSASRPVNWTAAQLEAFEQFRSSRGQLRLELADRAGRALPKVLNVATLEIQKPLEQQPEEAEVLKQLGPPDNSFTFDRHPEYMGGNVAASVNLAEYRVYMYELGCYQMPAHESASSEAKVFCSTLDIVTFRRRAVMTIIIHDTPEGVRRALSTH